MFASFCKRAAPNILPTIRQIAFPIGHNGHHYPPISDKKKSTVPEPDTVLFGGDYRDRTGDLLHAMQALSQLS